MTPARPQRRAASASAVQSRRGMTHPNRFVLIVDDDPAMGEMLAAMLGDAGFGTAVAGSAREAVDKASVEDFDVVLSDMAMPGTLDGLGLAELLRERHPELPVVLITGYASQLHEAAARRFTVLAKPCPPDVLIAAVRSALRGQTASDADGGMQRAAS